MTEEKRKNYAGEIRLSFVNRGGRTVAEQTFRRGNSRISANIPAGGGIPYYFLISTGGGYTEGESYLQEVELKDHTHAILTTQTPNYIFKCEHGLRTEQKNILHVGKDSTLEYYIDETIPYANAIFQQDTEVFLEENASLILTDGLTSGWSQDGSSFQYGRIGIRARVSRENPDTLLFNDYLLVDPGEDPMEELGFFEGSTNFNSAVIIDARMNQNLLQDMQAHMGRFAENKSFSCRYGMSLLEQDGAVLRVLGGSSHQNRQIVWEWIRYYREQIRGFSPFELRKDTQS